jgi:hypothetical protein
MCGPPGAWGWTEPVEHSEPVEDAVEPLHDVVAARKGCATSTRPPRGLADRRATKEHPPPRRAVAALDIDLTEDEVTDLEQPYVRRVPTYF